MWKINTEIAVISYIGSIFQSSNVQDAFALEFTILSNPDLKSTNLISFSSFNKINSIQFK